MHRENRCIFNGSEKVIWYRDGKLEGGESEGVGYKDEKTGAREIKVV